ncbi:MAG TPA: SMC-Scp complex subunit ScpB [Opitutaceae bacterium]|nr:SMC-Scp complex subunit ScpB [Opitutaceae bacterium]
MAFNLQKVLKSLLFASSGPLTVKDIQAVMARFHDQRTTQAAAPTPATAGTDVAPAAVDPAELADADAAFEESDELYVDVPSLITTTQIHEAMDAIAVELKERDEVYFLIEGAHGYRLVTNPKTARWVRVLRDEPPPIRLSQAAMETLAVIAYRQPTTRAEIETIRGVSAEAGLNKLLERGLVQVMGRADLPGRPIQYGTTDDFLEFVGIKSIDEIPASDVLSNRQISDWLEQSMNPRHVSGRDLGLDSDMLPLHPGTDDSVTVGADQRETRAAQE